MGIQLIGNTNTVAEVEANDKRQLRVAMCNRGTAYGISSVTGTMAAALGANSSVFVMRLDPGSANRAFIERVRFQFTTIVAFTTPVTAGRRLGLFRGSGAAASGGTAIAVAIAKHSVSATSEFNAANGGDMRISTTAALTVTGITYEAEPLRLVTLTHVGAAGGHYEGIWEFHATENAPIVLEPGQLLALRNPVAMDAAGTWTLNVNVDWHEAPVF